MFVYWSKIPDVCSDVFTKKSPVQKLHTTHIDRFGYTLPIDGVVLFIISSASYGDKYSIKARRF